MDTDYGNTDGHKVMKIPYGHLVQVRFKKIKKIIIQRKNLVQILNIK